MRRRVFAAAMLATIGLAAPSPAQPDSRSLFRRVYPNLALITACFGVARDDPRSVPDELPLETEGGRRDYPPLAFNASSRGIVVLELSTDASGIITDARALTTARPAVLIVSPTSAIRG